MRQVLSDEQDDRDSRQTRCLERRGRMVLDITAWYKLKYPLKMRSSHSVHVLSLHLYRFCLFLQQEFVLPCLQVTKQWVLGSSGTPAKEQ